MIIIENDLKPDTIVRISDLLLKQEEEIRKLEIEKAKLEGQLEEARRHEKEIQYVPYYPPYYPYQYYWTCSSDTGNSASISSSTARANNNYTDHIQFT